MQMKKHITLSYAGISMLTYMNIHVILQQTTSTSYAQVRPLSYTMNLQASFQVSILLRIYYGL